MDFIMPDRKIDYEVNKLDAYPALSDEMRAVVDYQAQNAKDAFVTDCSWDELRQKYVEERRFWNEGGPTAFKTVNMTVPGPAGEVPVRIYYPDEKPFHHAVIFIHGGGFTVGSNDTHDRMMRTIMGESGCAVIGVDYHLAPEYKFPIPLYESAAVVRFFHEQGKAYGILPDKMALCGDSGGANPVSYTHLDVYKRQSIGHLDGDGKLRRAFFRDGKTLCRGVYEFVWREGAFRNVESDPIPNGCIVTGKACGIIIPFKVKSVSGRLFEMRRKIADGEQGIFPVSYTHLSQIHRKGSGAGTPFPAGKGGGTFDHRCHPGAEGHSGIL